MLKQLRPHFLCKMREKPLLPIPHSFVSKLEAPKQKELGHISVAEFVAYATEQHLKKDIGRDFAEGVRHETFDNEGNP